MKKLIRRGLFTSILIIIGEILCFSMILGCSNKNPLDSDNNQADTDKLNEVGFPLAIGNKWIFHVQGEMTTIEFIPPDTTVTNLDVDVLWEITAKEQVLGVEAFRMETTHHFASGPDSGKTFTGLSWYTVKGDTLIGMAYQGDLAFSEVSTAQLHKVTQEPEGWGISVLIFPLEVGKEWWRFAPEHELHQILGKKVVEAVDKIAVPAGNFDAFRIMWSLTSDDPNTNHIITINQWFTSIGVVKYAENINLEGVLHYEYDENGNIIEEKSGKLIKNYIMELVSYQIEE